MLISGQGADFRSEGADFWGVLSGLKREHFKSMKADVIQSGQI